MVGGPTGTKLSSQYEEILSSLVPSTDGLQAHASPETEQNNDDDKISAWLEEKVPNFDLPTTDLLACIPPDLGLRISKPPQQNVRTRPQGLHATTETIEDRRIPRVDLYRKLLATYESEKARWAQYKTGARPKDDAKQSELEAYDELLQTYAPVVDAKLEELWTLLVVRGQYHRVRSYMSKIGVDSKTDILQRARDDFRACVSRSVDDSQDIYPVAFSPANWAADLSTDLQPDNPDKAQHGDVTGTASSPSPTMLQVPKVHGGASTWHTIEVQFKANGESTENMVKNNVIGITSSNDCPLWSDSSTATTTTADSCQMSDRSNTNIQLGFNVLKVDIERPWMNAEILNQIQHLSRTVDTPVATYDPLVVSNALQSLRSYREADDGSDPGLLPSFPASFIVAKDVHIIYTNSTGFSDSTLNGVQSSSSAGGRFLCFQSSSSTDAPATHQQKTSVSSTSNAISVKIPVPQVIGWISELVAKDSKDQDQP